MKHTRNIHSSNIFAEHITNSARQGFRCQKNIQMIRHSFRFFFSGLISTECKVTQVNNEVQYETGCGVY